MTDSALANYRPRFARPGNDDLSDDGSNALAFWSSQAQPYINAGDVWSRAVYGALGYGPGVYDEEIIPAGTTLAGMAHSGSLFGTRPFNALGAGGRPRINLTDEQISLLRQMRESNRPNREIADALGVKLEMVSPLAKRHGLEFRPQGYRGGVGANLTDDDKSRLNALYNDGRPMREIANALGVSRGTVHNLVTDLELARRGTSAGLPRALTPQLDEQLGKAYVNGVPVPKLEKDYGVSPGTMRNAADRLRSSNPDEYSRPRRMYDPRRYIDVEKDAAMPFSLAPSDQKKSR